MYRIYSVILCFCILTFLCPIHLLGKIEFYEVLPNTIDDTNLEYIELRNTGCNNQDIIGHILEDASGKRYIFGANSSIEFHSNIHISRTVSKIILNNTDEILYFKDPSGSIISQFSYVTSIKGEKITNPNSIDMECPITDTSSGESDSSQDNTGSIATGSTVDTASGNTEGETTFSGEINTPSIDPISSGSTNTGSSVISGEISNNIPSSSGSEIVFTGVTFPEIIPYIQHPTNAVFSGGIFDCTNQNPCRINLTFDPIFAPSFLQRNYICEIITDTGSLYDCNPNTLYFNSGSSISFRLSSKIEVTQSISKTWNVVYKNVEQTNTSSGSIQSESTNTSSGEVITSSGIPFPEIIPVFQNYTNVIFSGGTILCNINPCRLNMNFDGIFTGSFQARDYICEITYSGSIHDCNPPQLYLEGTGSINVAIIHKLSKQRQNLSLEVVQKSILRGEDKTPGNIPPTIQDTNPPVLILEYDGRFKSYHEQVGEYEMNCYTETCSINLTAEKSYDPEGGKLEFLWYYGFNDIKTSKDPGERKYGIGNHQIWLRVIDTAGNVSQIRYYIHVLGTKIDNRVIEKVKKIKVTKEIIKKEKLKKTKKKIKKMTFFEIPEISLQKSKFIQTDFGYICKSIAKNCSLNLKINSPQKGIHYTWIYEDGSISNSKNPKSKSFTPGKHIIKIIAGYSPEVPIWSKNIVVEVIKIRKPKKLRKQKTKKIVQISGSNKEKIEPINTKKLVFTDSNNDEHFPMVVLALIGGIMPMYYIRKTLSKTKSKI